ncbi:MAG: hypothetical protein M3386_02930, partial [Actinomycetota bacterium]|nr:hypothetical protein [Actinomycetota bacterium]
HLGVDDIAMPLSPHRVWQSIQGQPISEAPRAQVVSGEQAADPQPGSGQLPTGGAEHDGGVR